MKRRGLACIIPNMQFCAVDRLQYHSALQDRAPTSRHSYSKCATPGGYGPLLVSQ